MEDEKGVERGLRDKGGEREGRKSKWRRQVGQSGWTCVAR